MKRAIAALVLVFAAAPMLRADVILTSENLNESLKTMQRLQQQASQGAKAEQVEALFDLGVASDALASLLTDEVAEHGMQETQLLELAMRRTREMGHQIEWSIEKRRFFYEGAAFRAYLQQAPKGRRGAEASFWMVETEFYKTGREDAPGILKAVEHKKNFLKAYPRFKLVADVGVFLAIDYRDLYRRHASLGETAAARRFRKLAREQLTRVASSDPSSEAGRIALETRKQLDAEPDARGSK